MLQRHGMVLKRRVPVGLRQVTRVSGLSDDTEIGQAERAHDLAIGRPVLGGGTCGGQQRQDECHEREGYQSQRHVAEAELPDAHKWKATV